MDTSTIYKISKGEKELARGIYTKSLITISLLSFINIGIKKKILERYYFPFIAVGGAFLIGFFGNEILKDKRLELFENVDNDNVSSARIFYGFKDFRNNLN